MLIIIVLGYNIFYYNSWLYEFHKVVQNLFCSLYFLAIKKVHIKNFGITFN